MTPDENYLSYIIRSRRTIHSFTPDKVPDEVVYSAIECARWAPNHKLTEPWRVILVGDTTARKIVDLNTRLVKEKRGKKSAEAKRERWKRVPNWIAITSTISDDSVRTREDYAATCCFIQNLTLYLWSKGIGAKWTTGAVTRYDDVYELIGVDPQKEDLVGLLWYGYPAGEPQSSQRKPVAGITRQVD
ncbi:MAG: nitroreductase [Rhodothermales bacterium]|nr:nitroreductase [Rhodothermales bacterium]